MPCADGLLTRAKGCSLLQHTTPTNPSWTYSMLPGTCLHRQCHPILSWLRLQAGRFRVQVWYAGWMGKKCGYPLDKGSAVVLRAMFGTVFECLISRKLAAAVTGAPCCACETNTDSACRHRYQQQACMGCCWPSLAVQPVVCRPCSRPAGRPSWRFVNSVS